MPVAAGVVRGGSPTGYPGPMSAPDDRPDTAMATGNDEDGPGGRPTGGPLDERERAELDALAHPEGPDVVTDPVEETDAYRRAVEDGTPL